MARPSANSPGEHDKRVPASTTGVSQQDLETRLVLQKRQKGHLPDHDHPEPLPLVIQGQNNFIHGQVSANYFLLPVTFTALSNSNSFQQRHACKTF